MDHKLSIGFITPGMPFDGNSLERHSLGGSETMGLLMAREMAKRGHYVAQFSNCQQPHTVDNVNYFPVAWAQKFVADRPIDVIIGQRSGNIFASKVPSPSKIRILWHHDLAIHRHKNDLANGAWNTTEHWLLSEFHRQQYKDVYSIPEDRMWVTRNGIDMDIVKDIPLGRGREKNLFVYAARPERGLECLLTKIMPGIWEKHPDMKLGVCGYDNTTQQMKPLYDRINGLLEADNRLINLGYLTKKQLMELYSRATAYIYPTEFEEISCISVMEAAAHGLPVIHTGVAALAETVKSGCGIQVNNPSDSQKRIYTNDEWQTDFIKASNKFLEGKSKLKDELAIKKIADEEFNISALAETWEGRLYEIFERVNNNPLRLAKHFYYRSEIDGMKELLPTHCDKNSPYVKLHEAVVDDFSFEHEEQYNKIGDDTQRGAYDNIKAEPRFQYVIPFIDNLIATGELPEDFKCLDYGCAYAGWIGHLSDKYPKAKFFGVDISETVLEHGRELIAERADNPDNVILKQGSTDDEMPLDDMQDFFDGSPDLVMCFEVVEHCPDPIDMLNRLDAICKPGGMLLMTTPAGPWEEMDYQLINPFIGLRDDTKYPHRCHIREIEEADIRDMVGHKTNFGCDYIAIGRHTRTQDALGIYLWWYKSVKDERPVQAIDMQRKLDVQAPRETVSVCMIVKDASGMLKRCLDSIAYMAVEIIAIDTGSTDNTKEILAEYGAQISDGPNPIEAGFDECRNMSIEKAIGDWIHWIDTDEELTNQERMYRYFQNNIFDAYQIRQVHHTVEPAPGNFKPDLPARFFRNKPEWKFYGMVHEHPELNGMNEGPGFSWVLPDVDISHYGYLTESIRKGRFVRNIQLMLNDRKKYPDRVLGQFLMIRDRVQWARFVQQSTGSLNQEAVDGLRASIDEVENGLLKPGQHLDELMGYYTESHRLLGLGQKYIVSFDVFGLGEQGQPAQHIEIITDKSEIIDRYKEAKLEGKLNQLRSGYY